MKRPLVRPLRLALFACVVLALPAIGAGAEVSGPYLAAQQAARDHNYREMAEHFTRALAADPANQRLMEGLLAAHVGLGDIRSAVPVARRLVSGGARPQAALAVLLADQVRRLEWDQVIADLEGGRVVGPLVDGLTRAWAELGAGRMGQALLAFDRIAETPGLDIFGLYHKAMALASVGDFEGADALFSDPANRLRGERRGVIAHALILGQIDRHDAALALLDEAFAGRTDPEIDRLREALAEGRALPFDMVTSASDGVAEVFLTVAMALQSEAAPSQTLLYSRLSEYLRPEGVEAILMSASLLERLGQYALAIESYASFPPGHPMALGAGTGRAQAMYSAGRRDEAVTILQELAESHADFAQIHIALGDMLRREERFRDAAEAYSRAIQLIGEPESRHWALFYSRAIAWERAKEWDRAEPDFFKALELNPEQPSVLNYLGYSWLDMGRNIPEALDMIKRAVAQRPDDGYIIDSLAWGYFLSGRFEEAVEPMERAALLMPMDPIVTDHLGDVYWAVGRKLEARFQWRRALSYNPEEKDAERIRRKLEIGLDAVLEEEGATPLSDRRP